ncbi:MAG TPA: cation-transporting P-type ATPase [Thermomicrobiaceae bacterium]|nr:cation-transporting P-type ATPase [Thermomicrobiaceae bacterium]
MTSQEARARLAAYGPNLLVPAGRRSTLLRWLLKPLADPMVLLLLVAGGAYLLLRDYADAIVILVAVVPITLVTVVLESRAERTLEQLRSLTAPTAAVWRDGWRQVIPAGEIVPGDVVFLQEGDVIPADGALLRGRQLMVDESVLTGESQPVLKDVDEAPAVDLYAGTTLLAGRGVAQVTATGSATRYGQIGTLLAGIRQPPTPLQRLINRLIRQLAVVAALFCFGVAGIQLAAGRGWAAAIIAGVSLAIAAIPEEFPMVYTLYLTLGAWRLARDHALIRRLPGVETLGATTVICTDKTGTLTLGHLEVGGLATADGVSGAADGRRPAERALLEAAVLASEPNPFDPLDQAVLRFAAANGVDVAGLQGAELVRDYPFDPAGRYLSHVWRRDGRVWIAAKGALEGILARSEASPEARERALAANARLAEDGMRVIAVAAGDLSGSSGDRAADESALRFAGLVAFTDPLRPGVLDALAECRAAGIRVIMITGDHPVTAHAVAEGLDLPHDDRRIATGDDLDAADAAGVADLVAGSAIFARTRPEQKHRLVVALRERGEVVAMTGDGINDAPALREADIGIAMGERGTEVAREAATMVLLDDNFATIVRAVRDGRRIFDNLRRAFTYLVAFHAPLLVAALVIPLLGRPLLLLPIHLVWLELIVHPTASLVFEGDPPAPDLMRRPPRRAGSLLSRADFLRSLALGAALSIAALVTYLVRLPAGVDAARSLAIATLVLGQTLAVFLIRAGERPLWRAGLGGNRLLPWVIGASLLSLLAALYVPPVARLLSLAPLGAAQLGLAALIAAASTLWWEIPLLARRGR